MASQRVEDERAGRREHGVWLAKGEQRSDAAALAPSRAISSASSRTDSRTAGSHQEIRKHNALSAAIVIACHPLSSVRWRAVVSVPYAFRVNDESVRSRADVIEWTDRSLIAEWRASVGRGD